MGVWRKHIAVFGRFLYKRGGKASKLRLFPPSRSLICAYGIISTSIYLDTLMYYSHYWAIRSVVDRYIGIVEAADSISALSTLFFSLL